jgi:hypothetical protein
MRYTNYDVHFLRQLGISTRDPPRERKTAPVQETRLMAYARAIVPSTYGDHMDSASTDLDRWEILRKLVYSNDCVGRRFTARGYLSLLVPIHTRMNGDTDERKALLAVIKEFKKQGEQQPKKLLPPSTIDEIINTTQPSIASRLREHDPDGL